MQCVQSAESQSAEVRAWGKELGGGAERDCLRVEAGWRVTEDRMRRASLSV